MLLLAYRRMLRPLLGWGYVLQGGDQGRGAKYNLTVDPVWTATLGKDYCPEENSGGDIGS